MYVTGGVGSTGNEGFGEPYVAAEHLGVLRDVRGADVHHAEPPAVPGDRRQQVHRRHGTRHVQQRDRRRVGVRRSVLLRQPPRERRRRPRRCAGSARRSNAARRISCGSSRRCRASSTRRIAAARSTSISTSRARRRSTSPARRSALVGRRARCRGAASRRSRSRRRQTRVTGAIKLRIPGWARNQPAPGGLYRYVESRSSGSTTVAVNGRQRQRRARRARLRLARSRVEERRRRRGRFPDRRRAASSPTQRVQRRRAAAWRSSAGRSSTARSGPTPTIGARWTCVVDADRPSRRRRSNSDLFGGVTVIRTEARQRDDPDAAADADRRSFRITCGPIAAPAR